MNRSYVKYPQLSCEVKDDMFVIHNEHGKPIQTLPCSNIPLTGFSKHTVLVMPYLFVTEPFTGSGKIWVYKWVHLKSRRQQFQLVTTITRPTEMKWAPVGFAQAIHWEDPYLFITDTTYPNFHGSLFMCCVKRSTQVNQLYQHATQYECVGHTLSVTCSPDPTASVHLRRSKSLYHVVLSGVNRLTGESFTKELHFREGSHASLELIADEESEELEAQENTNQM